VSSGGSSAPGVRLVELDRLLRDIQAELLPDHDPDPVLAPPAPPAPAPPPPTEPPVAQPQLRTLTELSARLLASMRELLAGYERVLVGPASSPPPRRPVPARRDPSDVTLSAAPFPSLEALHAFEQAVARLPGVREVAVQGYEGTDRAIIEVRLDPPR
jgi:hypothetical protein